ncbi:hypothetical protein QFW96_04795 [Saccharopolyspora sp. TS4A08]|uniref:Uncharacterized protein n=1 Tax=Saccharopolyspora ipomoeae TaxID=3042027 RepID=A0ABT6PK97_9PSEU|nr:hypothetical protein [Saccharopolyspora sp. TS4A08]MDI2027911.1 hypothetical protein [Saccharopolyspora sp. TS4A08]
MAASSRSRWYTPGTAAHRFDLDDHRERAARERMGPGWRDTVLPRPAELAPGIG